jgi:hypothetical protein
MAFPPGRLARCSDALDAELAQPSREVGDVDKIAVVDHELGRRAWTRTRWRPTERAPTTMPSRSSSPRMRREVSVEKLEAYREAGSSVYDLLDRVHQQRDELRAAGRSPWDADRGLRFLIAFAWNAFRLQTMGDEFIEAARGVAGFLPRLTAEEAVAFYGHVEPWISRPNQAASNPAYVPDVHLPTHLLPLVGGRDPLPSHSPRRTMVTGSVLRRHVIRGGAA